MVLTVGDWKSLENTGWLMLLLGVPLTSVQNILALLLSLFLLGGLLMGQIVFSCIDLSIILIKMHRPILADSVLVGSLKMNTTLEYSTRVVQEGDRRCKKSTLNDLAYLTPLRIPLMNPVFVYNFQEKEII
jgi:hypothetical protein